MDCPVARHCAPPLSPAYIHPVPRQQSVATTSILGIPALRPREAPQDLALSEKTLVVAHHQLRLELLHRVERDADHDQDRRAAEEEVRAGLVDENRGQGGDG